MTTPNVIPLTPAQAAALKRCQSLTTVITEVKVK
jgi:hypothetical protein